MTGWPIGRKTAYWAQDGLLGARRPIGRKTAYWAQDGLLGARRPIGRKTAYWAQDGLLGARRPIGRKTAYWAQDGLLGARRPIGRKTAYWAQDGLLGARRPIGRKTASPPIAGASTRVHYLRRQFREEQQEQDFSPPPIFFLSLLSSLFSGTPGKPAGRFANPRVRFCTKISPRRPQPSGQAADAGSRRANQPLYPRLPRRKEPTWARVAGEAT